MQTALAILLLAGAAAAVSGATGTGQIGPVVIATLRATAQLAAVGVVIVAVFRTPGLAPAYLLVMLMVAAWTSGRRLGGGRAAFLASATAVTAGALVSVGIVLETGALPLAARTAVPFAAQLVGGSMTATTLAGQRLLDDVAAGWNQVEGWLALGATSAQAVQPMARTAAARALVPAIDQTRSVGLVVLPGAYVGLLLGGASPVQAGRVQLLVLIGLLAAEAVAAAVITQLLALRVGIRRPLAP